MDVRTEKKPGIRLSAAQMRFTLFASAFMAMISCPRSVLGGPGDSYGSSAILTARAGAGAADTPSTDAALINPARLSEAGNVQLMVGINVVEDRLNVNDQDAGLDTYVGYVLGLAARLPLGSLKDRIFLGAHLHLPHEHLYDLQTALADEPRILFHDAHTRHFEFAAGMAVRLWNTFSVGIGFTLLPNVDGTVSIDFRNGSDAHATDIQVNYNMAPTLGLSARPWQGLSLGFCWRGAHRTALHIPVDVVVSEQIGAIHTSVSGIAFGEPDRFLFGIAYDFGHLAKTPRTRFTARAEFGYDHYRKDVASTSYVTLYDEGGNILDVSEERPFGFHDSWHLAASLDWTPLDALTVMAGYAWHKTPVPAQRSVLNILDASRHQLSFGMSAWLPRAWLSMPREIGFSTAAMIAIYQRREMEKFEMLNGNLGYPGISFDGSVFSWHLSLLLQF